MPITQWCSATGELSTLVCFALCCAMAACRPAAPFQNAEVVKKLIQARIDDSVDATRTKDIDRYMRLIPQDWAIHDEKGAMLGREDLRRNVLQEWSIIEKTISLSAGIDRLEVHGNDATVWTSQRWERLMHERTGPALDDVLTTQRHEEHWRFVAGTWWCYEVKELGGDILLNGKPYHE